MNWRPIDPLFLFVRLKDGNDCAEAMNKLDPVRALARDTGCHILGTHHAKKGRGAGGDAVLGSTGPARDEATKQLVLGRFHYFPTPVPGRFAHSV